MIKKIKMIPNCNVMFSILRHLRVLFSISVQQPHIYIIKYNEKAEVGFVVEIHFSFYLSSIYMGCIPKFRKMTTHSFYRHFIILHINYFSLKYICCNHYGNNEKMNNNEYWYGNSTNLFHKMMHGQVKR